MNKKLLVACTIVLGVLLALSAFYNKKQNDELESVKTTKQQSEAALEKNESERDDLKVKVAAGQQDREQLQEKVDELTRSREQLQEKVDELARSREQLQEQVEKLIFSNDQSHQKLAEVIDTRDKLTKELAELSGLQDKLQQKLSELCDVNIRLSRQIKKVTESRDEVVAKAQKAQERIGINEHPAAVTPVLFQERPVCHSFDTIRPQIIQGQSSILSWQVANANRIRIEPDIGPVSALGSVAVKPSIATTYTLIATNKAGESKTTCRIEVTDRPTVQGKL
jgi:peptidoglycan hydrolase CwlO-like protein